MKILLNYANDKYKKTQRFNSFTGKVIGGFDRIYSFGPEDIDPEYKEKYKTLLSNPRGNGLWLWKPYFILRVMENSENGSYIFYSDSGAFFIRSVDLLIKSMDQDIWVSDIPLLEESFTKEKCFIEMDCTSDFYRKSNQIQATFILLKNTEYAREFVRKWQSYCERPELLSPNDGQDENDQLISHREDQSILSLLCKKEGVVPHRDPSHRGRYEEWYNNGKYPFKPTLHYDEYKSILFLHKTKNVSLKKCFVDYIKCIRAHDNMRTIKK